MARALIVCCGCRGQALVASLITAGHTVRGTSRREERLGAIEATGAEAVVADPDRLPTLTPQLEGVSVLCWLLGTAMGEPGAVAAIHGPRLASMLAAIVDTPVRGFVYEAAGTVEPECLARGAGLVRGAAERHRIRVALIDRDPADHRRWLRDATASVERVLEE